MFHNYVNTFFSVFYRQQQQYSGIWNTAERYFNLRSAVKTLPLSGIFIPAERYLVWL